ncbi:MAG: PKD domain-containing protein [Bacteroidota bacterium]
MNVETTVWAKGLVFYLALLFSFGLGTNTLQAQEDCTITGPTELCLDKFASQETFTYELDYDLQEGQNTFWIVEGGTIASQTNTNIGVNWSEVGTHTIIAQIFETGSEFPIVSCDLQVIVYDVPDAGFSPFVRDICVGSTLFFEANNSCPSCTYEWTVMDINASIDSPNATATEVTFPETGMGTLTLTVTENLSGCVDASSLKFNVFEIPTPSFSIIEAEDNMGQLSVCTNQDILLDDTTPNPPPATTIQWDITNGTDSWTFYGQDPLNFPFPTPGTYTITLTLLLPGQPECAASTTKVVEAQQSPPIEIICPSVVCEGDVVTYEVAVTCGAYNWTVSDQGIIVADNGNSIDVSWTNVSGYEMGYVIFEGDNCDGQFCTAPSVQAVPIFPTAEQISGPEIACNNGSGTAFFSLPNLPGATYEWSYEVLSSNGGTVNPPSSNTNSFFSFSYSGFSGIIEVTAMVDHPIGGCSFTDTHIIEVLSNQINGPNQLCIGDPATFTIDPLPTNDVTWTIIKNGDPVLEETNSGELNLPAGLLTEGGSYSINVLLTGTNGASCVRFASFFVYDPPTINGIEGPLEVCLNTPYIYSVDCMPGDMITWLIQQNDILTEQTGCAIQVVWTEDIGPLVITVIRENNNGIVCASEPMSFNVSIIETPDIEITGNATPCPDGLEIYCASFSGATNYQWEINPALGSVIDGQGTDKVTVQWLFTETPSNVDLTLTATLCDNPVTTTFPVVLTPFDLQINASDICVDEVADFSSNASSASGYQWFVNNDPVAAPQGTNPVLNYVFSQPGFYTIRLQVEDADGCPGNFVDVTEIEAFPNPKPEINPIAPLPCPLGTPFIRTLVATPNNPSQYTYTWYYNNAVVGTNSPTLDINETGLGAYQVEISNGQCSNISDVVQVNYNCNDECCDPDPLQDFTVDIRDIGYDVECGFIYFIGEIEPFENAFFPKWEIVAPGFTINTIPINSEADLEQFNYAVSVPGTYFIYLSGSYYCEDLDIYCEKTVFAQLDVPFLTDFQINYNCVASGDSYDIALEDMSNYFESPSTVSYSWSENFSSSTGSNASFSIANVPANTSVEVCLNVVSGQYAPYSCELCKTLTIPDVPTAAFSFDQTGLCAGQLIDFSPDMPEMDILELEWDFGDGSKSRLYNVAKVFADPGDYDVSLSITSIYGCTVESTQTITVVENLLSGIIIERVMDCSATADLGFLQFSGPTLSEYLWDPNGETTEDITAMESGVYDLTVTDVTGCTFSPPPRAVILVDPFPGGLNTTENGFTDCSRLFLSLSPSDTYTYEWSVSPDPTGVSPVVGNFISIFNLDPGVYEVTVSAIGDNNTVCATITADFTITGNPTPPILALAPNTCEPNTVLISVTNYDEVTWSGPNVNGVVAQSIVVSQNGIYTARVVDENGCTSSTSIEVNSIIDFSDFLSGCYEYCKEDIMMDPPILFGIPGSFVAWEWRLLDEDGNLTILESGAGTIPDLTIQPDWNGKITLWVDNGDCQEESDDFCIEVLDCPDIECDGFTAEVYCTTCGCGNPYGGVRIYDSNGNLADEDIFWITWEVDGVIYDQYSNNPIILEYEGPTVFTAHIQYTSPDGSIVCDETLSIEVICHGDCGNYTFATCATVAGNQPECSESNSGDVCIADGWGGYVFVTDAVGNPIDNLNVDWFNDGSIDPNPYYLQGTYNCQDIPVRVFGFASPCDTLLSYQPDCCTSQAPDVYCNGGGEMSTQIAWNPVCGTEFFEVQVACLSGSGWWDPIMVSEPSPLGNYVLDVPFQDGCDFVIIRVRGFCASSGLFGEWSECVAVDLQYGCFEWGGTCNEFFWNGLDGGGKPRAAVDQPIDWPSDWGSVDIYPNPLQEDLLHLSLDAFIQEQHEEVQVQILDVNGQMIKDFPLNTDKAIHQIPMEEVAAGIYLVSVYDQKGQRIHTTRLVKATSRP